MNNILNFKKIKSLITFVVILFLASCNIVVSNNQNSLTASSQVSTTSSLAVSTNLNSQDQVSLVAIEVNKLPTRLDYSSNEVISTSGGELRVVYSDYSVRYISMRDSMIETNRLNISTLGNSSVTLKYQEGSIAKYITYNVNIVPFTVNINSVALDIVSSDVLRTQSVQLNPIITPVNGLVRDIKWSSSNPLIASVDNNGLVTPLNAGEVIITVTVNNLNKAISRLNILKDEIKEVVEVVNQPTTLDTTANITFALTTPSPSGTNIISTNQATSPKTVSINVSNNTSSVVIAATKLAGQTVAFSGTNSADVTAAGTSTVPTYTVNTTSVATSGGSKTFTLTVSESNKEDIVYNVSIVVENQANLNLELDPTRYSGSGNLLDTSVNTNDATIFDATFDNVGKFFSFDGINDFMEVADHPTIEPTTGSFSLEAWFYPTTVTGTQVIAVKADGGNSADFGYGLRFSNGNLFFEVGNGGVSTVNIFKTALQLNTWHHVIGSYDMNGNFTIYLNGVDAARAARPYTNIKDTSAPLSIGRFSSVFEQYFKGRIGEVRYYGKALTSQEAISNFNASKMNYYSNPNILQTNLIVNLEAVNQLSYSGSGSTWTDLAGGDNNANLSNAVFDGTNGGIFDLDNVNHFISIPHDLRLSMSSAGQKTIQLWVRFDALPTTTEQVIFSKMSSLQDYDGYFLALDRDIPGRLKFVTNTRSFDNRMFSTAGAVSANTWYLITVVFQIGGTNTIKVYVNTTEVISGQQSSDSFNEASNNLNISRFGNEANTGFNGKVGAFYFYESGLTPQQITDNFNQTKTRFGVN